ncbi:MAG: bile acid:sodium symporter family protein [Candidatus Hydrogenedentes bacterium]|nr:bile acid:sodium symporter family protein [Candidatus Hydrogenedentota bacterium]
MDIDSVRLNFSPESLRLLNVILGLIIFGVALDLRPSDFTKVLRSPKGPIVGLVAQFICLPAFTFLLTLILRPEPSIALGMILIASCPGGNLSNFLTHLAGGNAALSVTMTGVSTVAAVFMTPLNVSFWGRLNPHTRPILERVHMDFWALFFTIVTILLIPMILGMLFRRFFSRAADRLHSPFKYFSIIFFLIFLVLAFGNNYDIFTQTMHLVAIAVILHNATALSVGYTFARLWRLEKRDVRAVCIEVGIQNSALGLVLIFGFFEGLGGMALVAGTWGIWHVIVGLPLAYFWSRIPLSDPAEEGAAA